MDLNRYADRGKYRQGSIALWLATVIPAVIAYALHLPYWITVLVFIGCAGGQIILAALTYKRLKDAGLWGGLVILMILQTNFGPVIYKSVREGISINLRLGSFISLIPMIIGWFWPQRAKIGAVKTDFSQSAP